MEEAEYEEETEGAGKSGRGAIGSKEEGGVEGREWKGRGNSI